MSKGNSGILSKHQLKIDYSSIGVIGDSKVKLDRTEKGYLYE